jgi:hypothetical protein
MTKSIITTLADIQSEDSPRNQALASALRKAGAREDFEDLMDLGADEREIYIEKAKDLIYPGLEPQFKAHKQMIRKLARTLYELDALAAQGLDETLGFNARKFIDERRARRESCSCGGSC